MAWTTVQMPFFVLEAYAYITAYAKVLSIDWPINMVKTVEFRPGTDKDADGYSVPTAEVHFFWEGGYYARIFMVGHESHYGTHWGKIRWVKYKYPLDKEGRKAVELKGQNLHVVAMAEYFRTRTGEGRDYSEGNSPAPEYENKLPVIKAELGLA